MVDWWRSWHGAPTDPKWRTVAKRADCPTSLVVSVAWALLDRASQADRRGSIGDVDFETLADYLDCEPGQVERIVAAMASKGVLAGADFVAWQRRQPDRERVDTSATERKRKQRERDKAASGGTPNVTPCHTTSRHGHTVSPTEENRGEERRGDKNIEAKASHPVSEPKTGAKREGYPEDLERFWAAFPEKGNSAKAECREPWAKLTVDERQRAIASCPIYAAFLRGKDAPMALHAHRYLKQRRFEAHQPKLNVDGSPQLQFAAP